MIFQQIVHYISEVIT